MKFEIWASPEPTIARLNSREYRSQLEETGHYHRIEDIDLLAALGIDGTRYPVLWEQVAGKGPDHFDIGWAAVRLERLLSHGIKPTVTLLHHGSGPRYTSLTDAEFPRKFASYAKRVAYTFPHIQRWTPINEPTTTARFSTLYGAWYPNGAMDHQAFGRAIANEALGQILAMEEIRKVNPTAEFVYTDDIQHFVAADDAVKEYVAYKRERMYLSAELLLGRVKPGHSLWKYLTDTCNVPVSLLRRIAERPTPPSVLGFNYYCNSERYLITAPDGSIGNLSRVDVTGETIDPRPLLRAAYERLQLPIGLSEIHVNGSPEERLAWLMERYDDAMALRCEGVPFQMLGLWAAFGLVDWRSLLLRRDHIVEDGVYTFAEFGETPQPTLLSEAVQALAAGTPPKRPKITPWWRNEERRRAPSELMGAPFFEEAALV